MSNLSSKFVDFCSTAFFVILIFLAVVGVYCLFYWGRSSPSIDDDSIVLAEQCHFEDGNVSIDGCSAVQQYQDRIVAREKEQFTYDHYRLEIKCYLDGDSFHEGMPVHAELRCEPTVY